jgi:sulfite exporter TauE/SafE
MLSSIHPLGERSRHNSWALTVTFFTVGSVLAGSALGLVLGLLGSIVFDDIGATAALVATSALALLAGVLDVVGVTPPGPSRQVNEHWIGPFRGWVYGGSFGVELGLGFLTYIVTWGVYATYAGALLTASPLAGALVGATFGVGRSLLLLAAGYVDRPSRLTSFNRGLAAAGPVVRRSAATALVLGGVVMIIVGAL